MPSHEAPPLNMGKDCCQMYIRKFAKPGPRVPT